MRSPPNIFTEEDVFRIIRARNLTTMGDLMRVTRLSKSAVYARTSALYESGRIKRVPAPGLAKKGWVVA